MIYYYIKKIKLYKLFILSLFPLFNLILKIIFFQEKISIIIPTYNREKLILNTLKSCLNQTYNNIEILIIDDCSTDNTKSIINIIRDDRIKYVSLKKNNGASYARNVGIHLSKGKYIAFQDSDDVFHKDKLKKQINNLRKYNSDLDFCKISVIINDDKKYYIPKKKTEKSILNGNLYDELLTNGNFISTQSILVKKSYIKKYLFDTKLPRLQDYDLILRMIPNIKVSYTNEILVDLYLQNDSITNSPIKLLKSINILFEFRKFTLVNEKATKKN